MEPADKKAEDKKKEITADMTKSFDAAIKEATDSGDKKTAALFAATQKIALDAVKGLESEFSDMINAAPKDRRAKLQAFERAFEKKHDIDSLAELVAKDNNELTRKEAAAKSGYFALKGAQEVIKATRKSRLETGVTLQEDLQASVRLDDTNLNAKLPNLKATGRFWNPASSFSQSA